MEKVLKTWLMFPLQKKNDLKVGGLLQMVSRHLQKFYKIILSKPIYFPCSEMMLVGKENISRQELGEKIDN